MKSKNGLQVTPVDDAVIAQWREVAEQAYPMIRGPIVPGGEMTWGRLVGGLAEVGGVLVAGWLLRDILTYFVFPRSEASVGARYAILAVLRYIVVGVGFAEHGQKLMDLFTKN